MNLREDWERAWLKSPNKLSSSFYSFLYSIDIRNSEKILDVGCGDWKRADSLLKRGGWIIGCDIAYNALRMARDNAKSYENKMDLVQCDARYLPFRDNVFDKVISFETLPHICDGYEKVLEEISRTTKKYVIFTALHKEYFYAFDDKKKSSHIVAFDEKEIKLLVEKVGLSIEFMKILTTRDTYEKGTVPYYMNIKDAIYVVARKFK